MNTYTAKQITEILQQEDADINLRTVRYYTQIGLVPPLELIGNKRTYTEKHLHYFRAILTLSRTGESLASIQERLAGLPLEEIKKIGEQMAFFQPDKFLKNETYKVNEDIFITLSPRISADLKREVIDTISKMIEEKGTND